MENNYPHPRAWLLREYKERRQKNPLYSVRAFARHLDIPSGRLSQILSNKRSLTPALGKKIAVRLAYDPKLASDFLGSIQYAKTQRRKEKKTVTEAMNDFQTIDMVQFETISEPLHFSLLSLLETNDCPASPRSMASRLNAGTVELHEALQRLQKLNLIRFDGKRYLLQKDKGLTTSHDIQSSALQKAHKKVLQETSLALDEVQVLLRDITSITMAIDPEKIPEAKERIRNFRRSLSDFLESGTKKEVYRLNIQLVPVSKRGTK